MLAAVWYLGLLPAASINSNDQSAQIAALQKQVDELQKPPGASVDNQAVDALRQSVRKLETDIAKLPPGDATVAARLTAADNAMKSLGVALAALNKRSDDIAAKAAQAQEHAAAADKAVTDLRASVQDAAKTSARSRRPSSTLCKQRVAALEAIAQGCARATRQELGDRQRGAAGAERGGIARRSDQRRTLPGRAGAGESARRRRARA